MIESWKSRSIGDEVSTFSWPDPGGSWDPCKSIALVDHEVGGLLSPEPP